MPYADLQCFSTNKDEATVTLCPESVHGGCRFLVSQHPEVENKIIAELDSLGLSITAERPHPRKMTFADLGKLTYLQATIKASNQMSHSP